MKNTKLMDDVVELITNIDDMTAEEIGYAAEALRSEGALEVYTEQIMMKKNRPGTKLCVIVTLKEEDYFVNRIFFHTGAIGIRRIEFKRYVLDRNIQQAKTPLGEIRIKQSGGYGTNKSKIEYEDVIRIARENNISFQEAKKRIERELENKIKEGSD